MSGVYVGTLAAAFRSRLLKRPEIEKLAESVSLDELANRLRGTPYADALAKVQAPLTARKLELAFRHRLSDAHYSLMTAASKYGLLELYFLKNIAWDLKAVLKSRALGRSYEETAEYIDMHSEELVGRRDLIVKVLAAKDIQEASALLAGSEFSKDIENALAAFGVKNDIRFFDIFIDHAVLSGMAKEYSSRSKLYSSSRASNTASLGDMVALDIDSYNALTVLRAKLWALPEQETRELIVAPTFRIPLSILQRMITTESVPEAAKQLGGVYGLAASQAGSDEAVVDAIEEQLVMTTKRTAVKAFVWQRLTPATALALVKLFEFEVRNLAAVAIGVEARLPSKDVIAKLL